MQFHPPLQQATLLRRYKRFLADIRTPDGVEQTIHCPNTGAMTGCAEPGFSVWYSESPNPKRKYAHTWELAQNAAGDWIVINTQMANHIAEQAVQEKRIEALKAYDSIRREVRYGLEKSRIDLLLQQAGLPDYYIEVKSVTLNEGGVGYFPDAVTLRGQKHLRELMQMVQAGHRAAVLFVVAHSAIHEVKPASHIDPDYAQLCIQASQQGVEFFAVKCAISAEEIRPAQVIPVKL
ncbi:DNA/RNA nuclease SfsA [Aliidiomarina sp. Khilg15.8]